LEAATVAVIKDTGLVAGKLIEAGGWIGEEAGKIIEKIGVEIEKLGKMLEPAKKTSAAATTPAAEPSKTK
jgi:hypothetical protein